MSRQYFVRDRGRVIGPFSAEQLFDMRDRGQIQAYHEVSVDQRTWKAFDLMFPSKSAPDRPTVPAPPRPRPDARGRTAPASGSNRMFIIVVASAVGLLLVAGFAVGIVWVVRSGGTSDTAADGAGGKIPEGVITFASNTPAEERYRVLKESVCLIVVGRTYRLPNGEWFDLPVSTGSGFCVNASGHIVTNNHVVNGHLKYKDSVKHRAEEKLENAAIEPRIWVFFGGEKSEAMEVHGSEDYDVAVIKVDRKSPYYFAMCETPDDKIVMQDNKIVTAGFPSSDRQAQEILFGKKMERPSLSKPIQRYFQDADFEVTREEGDLKRKPLRGQYSKSEKEAGYLNHTARIAKGNSGGPLIAHNGTVMGINTLGVQIEVDGRFITQEGQNYALTMPQLRREIEKWVPGGGMWRPLPR